jgi:hypothetical protein
MTDSIDAAAAVTGSAILDGSSIWTTTPLDNQTHPSAVEAAALNEPMFGWAPSNAS